MRPRNTSGGRFATASMAAYTEDGRTEEERKREKRRAKIRRAPVTTGEGRRDQLTLNQKRDKARTWGKTRSQGKTPEGSPHTTWEDQQISDPVNTEQKESWWESRKDKGSCHKEVSSKQNKGHGTRDKRHNKTKDKPTPTEKTWPGAGRGHIPSKTEAHKQRSFQRMNGANDACKNEHHIIIMPTFTIHQFSRQKRSKERQVLLEKPSSSVAWRMCGSARET